MDRRARHRDADRSGSAQVRGLQGCDIIVAATALQVAARSVAEKMGVPYVFAAYSPTAAALAGAPQLVIPHHYDQHYWALQVQRPGIGAAHTPEKLTTEMLTRALAQALTPDVSARAKTVATAVRRDGVEVAVQQLERAARTWPIASGSA